MYVNIVMGRKCFHCSPKIGTMDLPKSLYVLGLHSDLNFRHDESPATQRFLPKSDQNTALQVLGWAHAWVYSRPNHR